MSKTLKIIIAIVVLAFFAGTIYLWTQSEGTSTMVGDYSDLTVCGDFPASTSDGGPTSNYFVCRSNSDGQCYYKKASFEQIPGCDPEFDKNPYGNEECFEVKTALYLLDGSTAQNTGNDSCTATTQTYFESKVSE